MRFQPDTGVDCVVVPALNYGERADDTMIDMLVLHYTGMKDEQEALDRLTCKESGVSCHYFVFEDGKTAQLVPEALRAWHAGKSSWHGCGDINSHSIGIEIANPGHEHGYRPFPEVQISSVIALCKDIVSRHEISPINLVAHSDIAPMRKEDPGELFPWKQLHEAGLGHFVEAEPISGGRFFQLGDSGDPVSALQQLLALHGFDVAKTGNYDDVTQACVRAFQRHYRAGRVDGIADVSTIATLHKSLKALSIS